MVNSTSFASPFPILQSRKTDMVLSLTRFRAGMQQGSSQSTCFGYLRVDLCYTVMSSLQRRTRRCEENVVRTAFMFRIETAYSMFTATVTASFHDDAHRLRALLLQSCIWNSETVARRCTFSMHFDVPQSAMHSHPRTGGTVRHR